MVDRLVILAGFYMYHLHPCFPKVTLPIPLPKKMFLVGVEWRKISKELSSGYCKFFVLPLLNVS